MTRTCGAAPAAVGALLVLALSWSPVSAQEPTQSMELAAGNTAALSGSNSWRWTLFIMGQDQALDQVKCVTYLLHPTFLKRLQRVCTRGKLSGKGFLHHAVGWGTFAVGVTIEYKNGRQELFTYTLTFASSAQGWSMVDAIGQNAKIAIPVTAVDPKDGHFVFTISYNATRNGPLEARSIEIAVRQDGTAGNTRWTFDVSLNDEPWLRLGRRSYNDNRKDAVLLTGASLITAGTPLVRAGDRTNSIRIVGQR